MLLFMTHENDMKTFKQLLNEAEYGEKNHADQGECNRRLSAEVDKGLRGEYNSSHPTQAYFKNCSIQIFSNFSTSL